MKELLAKYQETIDKLPANARFIILAAILGIILVIWYYSFWEDLQDSMDAKSEQIKTLESSVPALKKQLQVMEKKIKAKRGPEAIKARSTSKILSPKQARTVLHDLLMTNKHLVLLQLKNLPPKAVALPNSKVKIFEHGIIIKFLGDYFSTMSYLQDIEKLPWKIFWDKLEYKVTEYPAAEITLHIHTTSKDDDWIHV